MAEDSGNAMSPVQGSRQVQLRELQAELNEVLWEIGRRFWRLSVRQAADSPAVIREMGESVYRAYRSRGISDEETRQLCLRVDAIEKRLKELIQTE